ncbi:MAG: carbohydrate ABC transporter permease [Saccharofermentanales bacterium]
MLKKTGKILLKAIVQILFFSYAVSLLYPYMWIFINSLKTNQAFFRNIWDIPFGNMQWSNYTKVLFEHKLLNYFGNSVYITAVGTVISVMIPSGIAYVVAKYKFTGKNFIFNLSIIGFLIPSIGTLGALFKFLVDVKLYDTFLGLFVLYSGGFGMGFLIMYSFYKGVSWEYAEAAFIDGANDWAVYYRIMIPLAKPGLVALAIMSAINVWNDYFTPFMFVPSEEKYTVSVGLYYLFLKQQYEADWTTLFAAVFISSLPIFIVYILFQEKIVNNLTTGGLKG